MRRANISRKGCREALADKLRLLKAVDCVQKEFNLTTINIIDLAKKVLDKIGVTYDYLSWEAASKTLVFYVGEETKAPSFKKEIKAIPLGRQKQKKDRFYSSRQWRELRYLALKKYGRKCLCCGAAPPDTVLHVDHIKPRSKFPKLELDIDNLQILCKECNLGKSNKDCIDYR